MGLTDEQYRIKEARTELGIVAGNALNAAATLCAPQGYKPAETVEAAEIFLDWLLAKRDEQGPSPFLTKTETFFDPSIVEQLNEAQAELNKVDVAAVTAKIGESLSGDAPDAPTQEAIANVAAAGMSTSEDDPDCPKCNGRMWDNRHSKRNPKAPDFKCKDKDCDGVIWPPFEKPARRSGKASPAAKAAAAKVAS